MYKHSVILRAARNCVAVSEKNKSRHYPDGLNSLMIFAGTAMRAKQSTRFKTFSRECLFEIFPFSPSSRLKKLKARRNVILSFSRESAGCRARVRNESITSIRSFTVKISVLGQTLYFREIQKKEKKTSSHNTRSIYLIVKFSKAFGPEKQKF